MNIESYRSYCLSKKGVTEEFPFDESTLVFKVMGKMFALTDLEEFSGISLKTDPEEGADLREKYAFIQPAYHMNKKHWITVILDGQVPDRMLLHLTDKSYELVVSGLTKSQKLGLSVL